jgi:choline dehydrogenase
LIEAGAFIKSNSKLKACDMEILFAPLYDLERGLSRPAAQHGFTLLAAPLQQKSRGNITLASADPTVAPLIDPCYLAEAADREGLTQAAAKARSIAEASPFEIYRGTAACEEADDIEEHAVSLHHYAGTCRMGPLLTGDDTNVVDAALRVHGIAGLRVADASVMPELPRVHPNATVMMIAEKAALLIKAG